MTLGHEQARSRVEVCGQRRERGVRLDVVVAHAHEVGAPQEGALGRCEAGHGAPGHQRPEHALPADRHHGLRIGDLGPVVAELARDRGE